MLQICFSGNPEYSGKVACLNFMQKSKKLYKRFQRKTSDKMINRQTLDMWVQQENMSFPASPANYHFCI